MTPESVSPSTPPILTAIWFSPSKVPRSSLDAASVNIAVEFTNIIEDPIPWTILETINCAAENEMEDSAEPIVKIAGLDLVFSLLGLQ